MEQTGVPITHLWVTEIIRAYEKKRCTRPDYVTLNYYDKEKNMSQL